LPVAPEQPSAPPPDRAPLAALPPDLRALIEGPAILHLGTRGPDLTPSCVLAFGLRDHGDDRQVTVFVPAKLAGPPLADLRDNGQMALSVIRPTNNQAIQLKGLWLGERRTDDGDRAFVERYRELLTREMGLVGVPRSVWRRVGWWPTVALVMEVREVFVQTPGPGAGRRCQPETTETGIAP
jgi:hypothetical protein